MRQTNVRGSLSLRGFRKLRTGAIVATGVILLGLGFLAPTVSASEQDGVWVARTVEEVKADLQKEGDLFKYVIKWGDTLSVISEASNIPVDVLQKMNQASGKNLFLPHNELYFTEAETVSDTVTKHKIVIKESGASGEVRTYEVLLKKDQETKAVTFELTDVTEKVEKMAVNYSPVYQPVSAPVVERAEESGEELAPVAPKTEEAATTPVPKETAPEVVTPAAPKVEAPAESVEPKGTEPEVAKPAESNAETPAPKAEVSEAPVVEATTSGEQGQPAEETPAPKVEESAESAEPKTEAPTTPENKEEQPGATEATEPKGTEPEVAKPAAPKPAAPKAEEPTTPRPKEDETQGTGSEGATTNATSESSSAGTEVVSPAANEVTPSPAGEEANAETTNNPSTGVTTSADSGESSPVTDATPSNGETTEQPGTSAPEAEVTGENTPATSEPTESASEVAKPAEPKEAEPEAAEPKAEISTEPAEPKETNSVASGESGQPVEGTADEATTSSSDSTSDKVKREEGQGASETSATTETATTSTNGDTNEVESEKPVAEEQPTADGADSSAATSNSAESSPSTESTATEGTTDTTGNASNNSSTDVTTDGNSNDSTSHGEKPQADATAVENQSLKKETEDSNKAAIDDDRKTKDEEINKSTLSEDKKKEELEKLKRLTEEYHKKLATENDPDKQANLVDEYRDKLNEIETPGIEHTGPDFNKPIESHTGGTTIDENSTVANSALTSSNSSSQPSSSQTQPATTSDSSTTGNSGFRSAGTYQPRVTRRPRSVSEPQNKVSIYYNFDGMKDIPGFFDDLGSKNEVDIPKGVSGEALKSILKARIDKKKAELESRGYKISDEYFVGIDQAEATHYDYVVTFTKEATGTTGFRMAPAVQPRASRKRRSLEQPAPQKVKVTVFYNSDQMKDIAGFLGDINETPLEVAAGSTNEQVKVAVKSQVDAKKEELRKHGYTFKEDYVYQANGKDYNYVVTFSKATK